MNRNRKLAWLIALGMTGAMFALIALRFDVRFAVNDDSAILRAFLGYESGTPVTYHIYLHGLLAWPLHWLSTAFPGVVWYSWMQMALLFLAILICAKSIMQCFVNHRRPLWLGAVFAALFLLSFCMNHIVSMTFTLTAALLGAAAVLQLMSVDYARPGCRHIVMGVLGAAALAALAYSLRQITVLPILAVCGLAFVWLWLMYGRTKPMLIALALTAAVLGGMAGTRALETRASGYEDYLRFQEANTYVMDYHGLQNVTEEELAMVGWDRYTANLLADWCLLDSALTTESFETLTAHLQSKDQRTLADKLLSGWQSFSGVMKENPEQIALLAIALAVALAALVSAAATRRWRCALGILASLLLFAAMTAYLLLQGRLPLRAVYAPALPTAAFVFALLPACLPHAGLTAGLAAVLAAVSVANALPLLSPMVKSEDAELTSVSVMADLEEYALFEPESLFLFDYTVVAADSRAFPDYSEGVPNNVTFWGGWGMRSPENEALFERFGIDIHSFDPEALLREDVFIVSGRIDPPPTVLMDWLANRLGREIDCMLYSEYGSIYVFQFCEL